MRIIFILFFIFNSLGLLQQVYAITLPSSDKASISKNLQNWNNKQKITLLPHQLVPINYLEQHSEVKGLLIYHYLGTGKTYLAIGYAKRNPDKKIVILVPRFLKGQWLKNIKNYGIKNLDRYNIITHKEVSKLVNLNLSNTIVIIDESHKIISKLHSTDLKQNNLYSQVYLNIQKAYKVLSLTGTPIFTDITDMAYQVNLVAGKEMIPYNKKDFDVEFTKIAEHKSALNGYIAESKATPFVFAMTGWGIAGTLFPPAILPAIAAGYFLPSGIKAVFPVRTNPLRTFKTDCLDKISRKYITYYGITKENKQFYPSKEIHYTSVTYNEFQTDFLIRFADSQLSVQEIVQLQKDQDTSYGKDYISLNSTLLQDAMKKQPGNGLAIGNLLHNDPNNQDKVVYPSKFKESLTTMLSADGPVVLYSHFYHNGILLFKKYLDSQGYKNQYEILHPDLSATKSNQIVKKYNDGKLKFLLLHPEITEGISLKGTQQLHILETPFNKSVQEQVIGRTVRYKSHSHLPENKRHVDIYIWKPTFSMLNIPHNVALRNNWQRNFLELNFYGERTLVDPNNDMKFFTPDDLSHKNMSVQDENTRELVKFLQNHSIEKT